MRLLISPAVIFARFSDPSCRWAGHFLSQLAHTDRWQNLWRPGWLEFWSHACKRHDYGSYSRFVFSSRLQWRPDGWRAEVPGFCNRQEPIDEGKTDANYAQKVSCVTANYMNKCTILLSFYVQKGSCMQTIISYNCNYSVCRVGLVRL